MRATLVKVGAVVGLAMLAACAGGSPTAPPLLSLDGRSCAPEPDLARALPLQLVPVKPTTVALDTSTACWEPPAGSKSTYAAFQLPEAPQEYLVTVQSVPLGLTLFSPRLLVLDSAGKPLREVPRDGFQFHGTLLSTSIRAHHGERYLIVASDAQSIGKSESRIASSTSVSTTCLTGGCINIYAGHETSSTQVYAYSGSINVTAVPLPTN
jgi:hypothetical protein